MAIFHSKRNEMYATTTTKKTSTAMMAFVGDLAPPRGPDVGERHRRGPGCR